jgi:hypothetical protein
VKLWTGTMVGFCEYDNEPSGSIKAENLLTSSTFQVIPCTREFSENGTVWMKRSRFETSICLFYCKLPFK